MGNDYLNARESERANVEMREPVTNPFFGGVISLYIRSFSSNIERANPKNYLYILQDSDKNEIYRGIGTDKIPDYTSSQHGRTWYSYDYISLTEEHAFPLYLRVVYAGMNSDFIIEKTE